MVLRLNFALTGLISRLRPSRYDRFLGKDFLFETMRWGSSAGVDDVVRRDGVMPVHV